MIFGTVEATMLLMLATAFLGGVAYYAYQRSGDSLHPAIVLAPLFLLGLVMEPAQRLLHPEIVQFFPDYQGISFALMVQYLGMAALFAGMLSIVSRIGTDRQRSMILDMSLDPRKRAKVRIVAWSLAAFSLAGYWYGIYLQGGFVQSYSMSKGGIANMSGYFGEAQNLGVAALVFYAVSVQGARLTVTHVLIGLLMISPVLLHGTFGGRRGPLFIAGASMFVAYFIAVGRVPKFRYIAAMSSILLVGVVFIGSQRQFLYFGSGQGMDLETFWTAILGKQIESGDNFVVSSGAVNAIYEIDEYHWGRRFLTMFGVRPIPRALWPSKYDDISLALYGRSFADLQNAHYQWLTVLGWRPTNGYAINAIVDLFWEFSWGYVLALWFFGRGISMVWYRFRTIGGFWFVGYFLIAALAIYLPTQSFSAFAHRFLYLSVMSFIFWRFTVGRESKRRVVRGTTARPMNAQTLP
jgi:hypothetical protein